MTEWKAFRSPDFDAVKRALKSPVIFDGRNLYEPAVVTCPRHRVLPHRAAHAEMTRLPDFSRARVLVVGDVMLDRYWFGDVDRISPEAPVPVVRVKRTEERPGRRRQRRAQRHDARGGATLLTVVGQDEAGGVAGAPARGRAACSRRCIAIRSSPRSSSCA